MNAAGTLRSRAEMLAAPRPAPCADELPRRVQRGEPLLLATLALAGGLDVWVTHPTAWPWLAVLTVLAAAGSAALRPGTQAGAGRVLRGFAVLVAAAAVAVADPGLSSLSVAWVLATCALYPMLLHRSHALLVTSAALLALSAPVALRLLQTGPTAADELAQLAGRVVVTVVAVGLAGAARLTRRGLRELVAAARPAHPGAGPTPGPDPAAGAGPPEPAATSDPAATAAITGQRLPAGLPGVFRLPTARLPEGAAGARPARGLRGGVPDGLTGLPGRDTLLERTARALSAAEVLGGSVAVLMLELEPPRDGLDEAASAEALRQIARRLRAALPAQDLVARVGASTFALLVGGIDADGSTAMARRLTALVEEPVEAGGGSLSLACAIGVALAGGPGAQTAPAVVAAATAALHATRRGGGHGRWSVYGPALRAHARSQGALEADLHRAVRAGAITAAFQPLFALGRDGRDRLDGIEVLARWTRPDGAVVPPQRFIPVADQLGLGPALGMQVLDLGLATLSRWRSAGVPVRTLSVNLSPAQLEDPGLAKALADRVGAHGVPAEDLIVDVPAAGFVDTDQARSTLAMLRSLGAGVAVDDFGRSGMSLTALSQLPLTEVKLDRALTAGPSTGRPLVASMVAACTALGLRCVAEGVETRAQLEAARSLGVHAAQGFLLGRPAAEADALAGLRAVTQGVRA